jgi:hypothetical protein
MNLLVAIKKLYRRFQTMNTNGMARGYMAKNMGTENFVKHVLTCIERELSEQDVKTRVIGYILIDSLYIQVQVFSVQYGSVIPLREVNKLQRKSPYSLDRRIWTELFQAGLDISKDSHYIKAVLK